MKIVNMHGVAIPGPGNRRGHMKDLGLPALPRVGKQTKKTVLEKK